MGQNGRRRGAAAALVAAMLLAAGVGVGLGWERNPAVSSPTSGQGPAVAGAVTSVAPSSVPATSGTSTSTSSSATTGTTATTVPPAAPPSLAVSPARIDLGARGTTAAVGLRNRGDEPLSWTADTSASWLRVNPSTGRLDGGEQARLSVSVSRDGLPEGDADGTVELAWGGPARTVAVALGVEHAPELGGLSAFPAQLRVLPCTPSASSVQATVRDESPLASVVLRWGGQQVPMAFRNGAWSARLGPVPDPGMVPWEVVASDARGNSASAQGPEVQVLGCP
jgi:hypothetical protein